MPKEKKTVTLLAPGDGFEYVLKKKVKTRQIKIKELEAELEITPEPSDKELIELGKSLHPYYNMQEQIKLLKEI